jgi:uncharacterized OB-fold protein
MIKSYPLYIGNKLNGEKCINCGHIRFPRMGYCNICQSTNLTDFLIGPNGLLMSFTIAFKKPLVGNINPPYPYAVARFPTENGKSIDIFGLVISKEPFEDVKINKGVELVSDKLLVKFKMEDV